MFTQHISRALKQATSLILATLMLLTPLSGIASLQTSKPEKQGVSSEKLKRLSELSKQYVDEGRVAGIVNLVLRNGEIIHYEATGNRGADDPSPMKVDDLFRIYSMTKPIVSVAIMQLVEQGKIQLDSPITDYIPEFKRLNLKGDSLLSSNGMTMRKLQRTGYSASYRQQ